MIRSESIQSITKRLEKIAGEGYSPRNEQEVIEVVMAAESVVRKGLYILAIGFAQKPDAGKQIDGSTL